MKTFVAPVVAALALLSSGTHAHGGADEKARAPSATKTEDVSTPFGRTGDPKKVGRTVTIRMSDTMRFTPDSVTEKRGETIRFVVKNEGKILHEMVLGHDEGLKEHAALMRKFPEMEHDEPYMVHVSPGKTGGMIWTFDKPGEVVFACLIPGHYEADMTGKVTAK
jgi:uncharacterized cupredoxin-like copper-binding protein